MSLTLKSLTSQFLKWSTVTLKPGTVRSYQHHLRRFLWTTKNKQVRNLRPMHLTTAMRSWHDWQAVQRMFHWAVDEAGLLKRNPFAKVRAPGRNQRKRILTPQEVQRFIRRCRPRPRAFLLALRETFARPQEVRALRWDDLQAEQPATPVNQALATGRAVFVLHDFKDRAKRTNPDLPRVLLVTRRLGRLLLRLRGQDATPEGAVFKNSRGLPWTKNAVRCLMRRLRKRLGFERDKRGEHVVAYTFRHSGATLAASKGIVDRVLADLLGHVETRTTSRYLHLNVGHIREALKRMDPPKRDLAANWPRRRVTTKRTSGRLRRRKKASRKA